MKLNTTDLEFELSLLIILFELVTITIPTHPYYTLLHHITVPIKPLEL